MKTPVMRPPLEAVLFGFERIGMVVRIAWLPIVIVVLLYVGSFALLSGAALTLPNFSVSDPQDAMAVLLSSSGLIAGNIVISMVMPLVSMLILSCVYVAIIRASTFADFEPPSLPFYFALGSRELRYFVARFLYGLIIAFSAMVMAGLLFGVIGLTAIASEAVEGQSKALIAAPGAALSLWIVLIWLWIILRLLPVLPIAAIENRISFGEAWTMTRGNFWRLLISGAIFLSVLQGVFFIFFLLIIIPASVVIGLFAVAGFGLVGPAAFALFALLGMLMIPAMVALASFSLAAEAAFPARIYAYLSNCGEDCRLY